jgi:hypothetical protein
MKKAEQAGLTNREHEKTFQEMMVAFGFCPSNLARFDYGEAGDEMGDEKREHGLLSEDDEPSWVMRTISKTVQQSLERFEQKRMKLDELTQSGWEYAADYFCESDKQYGTSELRVQMVVKLQIDHDAAALALTTF